MLIKTILNKIEKFPLFVYRKIYGCKILKKQGMRTNRTGFAPMKKVI